MKRKIAAFGTALFLVIGLQASPASAAHTTFTQSSCTGTGFHSELSTGLYAYTTSPNCNGVKVKLRWSHSNGSWQVSTRTSWNNGATKWISGGDHIDWSRHETYSNGWCPCTYLYG